MRANSGLLLRAICAICANSTANNLLNSLARPATGNQPKIDIDPPPVSPQVERPLPRDAELFKSPAKRKRHDNDGAQTF